jgi:hypothetical protein
MLSQRWVKGKCNNLYHTDKLLLASANWNQLLSPSSGISTSAPKYNSLKLQCNNSKYNYERVIIEPLNHIYRRHWPIHKYSRNVGISSLPHISFHIFFFILVLILFPVGPVYLHHCIQHSHHSQKTHFCCFCNINQQMQTILIRFTILFLKTLNSYMFQFLLVHHQEEH